MTSKEHIYVLPDNDFEFIFSYNEGKIVSYIDYILYTIQLLRILENCKAVKILFSQQEVNCNYKDSLKMRERIL